MRKVIQDKGGAALASVAYTVGRGAGKLRPATGGASRVGAIVGGAAVTVLWAATCGLINMRKYREGKITKKGAIQRTTAESAGMGLATGIGVAAANAARASVAIASSAALVPFLIGTLVTGGAKAAWEQKVAKKLVDGEENAIAETGADSDEPQEINSATALEATDRST